MNKKVEISKELLSKLYERDRLSTFQIAQKLGFCQATIWKKLKEFNIKSRLSGVKRVNLSRSKLKELYITKKFSTWEIEKKTKISRSTIHRKLKEYGIERRDRATSHIIYARKDFSGDLIEKAYLIGFRLGDLGIRKIYPNSKTICVASGSTIKEQIKLIENLFKKYGRVWIKKTKNNKINIQINLNESFEFLLSKEFPLWVERDKRFFFSFLAGFTDAEGSIGVYNKMARFILGNYDKDLLFEISNQLNIFGIRCNKPFPDYRKGKITKEGYKYNQDYWHLHINSKNDLSLLFTELKHYIKHENKVKSLNIAIDNIKLRNKIKESKMKNKKTFYITTPVYYTNAPIHLGGAYTTIAADVLARWHKLLGEDVFFLTGTDEHGRKIQEIAEQNKQKPKEFVDKIASGLKEAFKILNISNDNFIRTTEPFHEKEVKKLLNLLYKKKLIYKGFYESYYCVGCEQYLTQSDLVEGKCPIHNRIPEFKKEEAYLFKLSFFQNKLLKLIKSGDYRIIPEDRRKEVLTFIECGLQDVSISRLKEKISWGIELPFDKKHIVWVWPDAFWNYVSGLKQKGKDKFDKFWPADIQLMAKDIIRVHATIWPALLLGAGYKLPKTLFVHGYFTIDGKKMSKSLGNVISPVYLTEKYGSDSVRYYLMRSIPFGSDGNVSEKALIERHNNELADKLGNLVSRVASLIEKNGIASVSPARPTNASLLKKLKEKEIAKHLDNFEFDKALNEIFVFVDACNEFVQKNKIWETKNKKDLFELKESILKIAELLSVFIPESAEKIKKQFSEKNIKKGEILFKKI